MPDVVVPLSKAYAAHEKEFTQIVLREPTYKEIYMDGLGKPLEWQMTRGGLVQVVYPEVVDAYLQRLIRDPGYERIGNLNAVDALALERAVCGFFTGSTDLKTPSTGSSSGQESPSKRSSRRRSRGSSGGSSDMATS